MSWLGIEGHDDVVEKFRRALGNGRLATTFLFVGPEGIGKRLFAERLAQTSLCEVRPETSLDPCGVCPGCVQVLAGTHPDLMVVGKPKDKSVIPVELLIGAGDKRMREGLCHDIGLKSFAGRRKIAIIDDADYLNVEGANCLLKTLEEPPPNSLLILISTSLERQLPTIRSRAQIIRFRPLEAEVIGRLLIESGEVADPAEALRLAGYAEGSLARARELADGELWEFRNELVNMLSRRPLDSVRDAKRVSAFVDQAGTEAAARRDRLRLLISFAIAFYREQLRRATSDQILGEQPAPDVERTDELVAALEACLLALGYIDRNVNQTTIIEWWLDMLAQADTRPTRQPAAGSAVR